MFTPISQQQPPRGVDILFKLENNDLVFGLVMPDGKIAVKDDPFGHTLLQSPPYAWAEMSYSLKGK